MRATLSITLVTIALLTYACAQTVVSDDRMPPDSIELKRNDPPATPTPWQLPKPGDPHYDAVKEAQIKSDNEPKDKAVTHHLVRTYERGVFKGYDTLQWESLQRRWTTHSLQIPSCLRMQSSFPQPRIQT